MKLPSLIPLGLVCLLAALSTVAETPPTGLELAKEALKRADAVKLDGWAFTATTVEDGRKTVERHDPAAAAGSRWQLVLKRGQPPTEKQRKKYAEERRHRGTSQQDLGSLVDLATLEVLRDEAGRLTCGFRMKADPDEAQLMAGKLRGTLVVLRDGPTVESLEIVNTGKISKTGVFSLSEFQTRLRFRQDPERHEALLESLFTKVRGRALLVKSLNVDAEMTFSDYRWVGVAGEE